MQAVKKSFEKAILLILLLTFSVAVVPLDFYHDHAEETVCKEFTKNGSCQHKLHLSKKSNACWACAVHYDKTYIRPEGAETKKFTPINTLSSTGEVIGYTIKLIATSLRGPPVG